MTGTPELLTIVQTPGLPENIASHFTNLTDIQNFLLTNKATYHFLTTPQAAQKIWGQFTATHNQKIPPNLYVTLAFQPRVHHYEDGSSIETFSVFELKLTQLNARVVMQTRQIPYIENPTLHLLGEGPKLEEETQLVQQNYAGFVTPLVKPTRDIIMRKELLNWLNCLYRGFRGHDLKDIDYRTINMFNTYVGSSFTLSPILSEMIGGTHPDFDLTAVRAQGVALVEGGIHGYQTYQHVIDILLSGVLSFDQFKSLLCPTRKTGTKFSLERLDPEIFDLFKQVQDFDKVKSHPLDTLLFFKKIYMIKISPSQPDLEQRLKAQLNGILVEMLSLPEFSCRTFCAVFLPKTHMHLKIEFLIQRLSLFLEAVRNGTLNLYALNRALERNPNLHVPLTHLSRAFYEAVERDYIPLTALLNEGAALTDFYELIYLMTEEIDFLVHGVDETPELFEHTQHLNQFYNRFMDLVIKHLDQKMDRHVFMREANQFLGFMKLLSIDFMRRLSSSSDVSHAFQLFLALREKTQNIYKDIILKHISHETHQDILLSGHVKEFILPQAEWRAMLPKGEYESYETWLELLETTYQKALTSHNIITQLRVLNTCPAAELEKAAQQIRVLSQHQDPQELTPAMMCLMSLHQGLSGRTIHAFYQLFEKLIPLFNQCNFPVELSIWDLIKDNFPLIQDLKDFPTTLQSTDPETLKEHIMLLKNEALRTGTMYFGTEAGYKLCQSFFSSPKRVMAALLLLVTGQWTKEDYIKVVKTFIAMHYERICSAYYQYDPTSFSFSYKNTHPRAQEAINVGLPDETSSHVFDPHIFADEILVTTLENILLNLNKTGKELWNAACLKADEGRVTVTP